jgi:hypothetical protein
MSEPMLSTDTPAMAVLLVSVANAHHVFEGNRRDAKTVPDVLRDIEHRFGKS